MVASLDENSEKNGRPRDPFFKDLGEGNFLVLVDETRPYSIALRTALHWIHNLEKSSEGSDANAELFQRVQTGLERIEQLSYSFRNLKSSTTSASNALSGLRRQLDELDRNLEEEVKSLGALLE